MNTQADNPLLSKICELENYIKTNYPKEKPKIKGFVNELRSIEPNLSVLGLLNHLAEMYKEGSTLKDIIQDVKKTKKVFSLAGEYVKTLEEDPKITYLSQEIHEIILSHLERAFLLYKREYDIPN